MKIIKNSVSLLEKEVKPFAEGFYNAIVGNNLDFDNTKHSYCRLFEEKAFYKGYNLGSENSHRNILNDIPDNVPDWAYITRYCLRKNIINPDGWGLCMNNYGNWFLDEN